MKAKLSSRLRLGDDRQWLLIMAAFAAIELIWWAIAWNAAIAPALLPAYLLFASASLAAAILLRIVLRLSPVGTRWPAVLSGTILVAIGASAFLPLKYAIPRENPFWLDGPLAAGERALFGVDPWLLLDHAFGWASVPLDWLYGAWLPTQALIMFLVMLSRPSPAKSRAMMAYAMAWFLLGAVAAVLLSSAGPLFYDRLFGGQDFAALTETLCRRGTWIALAESDAMWKSLASGRPGLVAGISAMPSVHVAIGLWIFLTARSLLPRGSSIAFVYFVLIWIASVQLGWHYVSDGAIGSLGMIAVWRLAAMIQSRPAERQSVR